jgi:serine/threonine protein kinase
MVVPISAAVHKGKAILEGQLVAIKRIKMCNDCDTNPFIHTFHQEVRLMKKLSSNPCKKYKIPRYFDSYVVGDELWLVMEYIQGESLFNTISWLALTKQEIATIFYHVLKAVEYMHARGVMHNDITFNNVMLAKNNEVKLIDFGLSTEIEDCMTNAHVSVRISAPELLKGEEYDSGIDIWAVGIMLWSVLFRQNVFWEVEDDSEFKELMLDHGTPPIPVGEKLEPDMADFLDQCLTVNRQERPSATQLLRHEVFCGMDVHSRTTVSALLNKVTSIMEQS